MSNKDRASMGHRLVIGARNLLLGLGITGAASTGFASAGFDEASSENTVEGYTSFILGSFDSSEIEQAFCRLRDLDAGAAESVAGSYVDQADLAGVDFQACATTGSARLINI
ncbi:hypothetical protein MCELHM10_02137 [Paracoccaceae bacterium]